MSPSSLAYALLTVQTKAAGPKQPGSWSKIAKKFENFLRREEGKNRSFFFPQNEVRLSDTDFFFSLPYSVDQPLYREDAPLAWPLPAVLSLALLAALALQKDFQPFERQTFFASYMM